jgi:sugar diacid utilization regulator
MAESTSKTAAKKGVSSAGGNAGALDMLAAAVESGAGLPEVARAAGAALGASVALIDAKQAVLAVAAGAPSEEHELLSNEQGVTAIGLRVAESNVGELRFKPRHNAPDPGVLRVVTTLLALEVERTRAPEQAGEAALGSFVNTLLDGDIEDRRDLLARGAELGIGLDGGCCVLIVQVHPLKPADGDWQARALTVVGRAARSAVPGATAALRREEIAVIAPGSDEDRAVAAGRAIVRAIEETLDGFSVVVGRSRMVTDPMELHRADSEALLAANVASPDALAEGTMLAFDDTGAYRLLLPAISKDPSELERFYTDTIAPLVGYDEQYGTELVATLEAFLANDGSMVATHKQMFTHRHTIRYRLDRIKELTGLDVSSTDGRERLGLGLKAMRVLGVRVPSAPVFEPGAQRGRVPQRPNDEINARRR